MKKEDFIKGSYYKNIGYRANNIVKFLGFLNKDIPERMAVSYYIYEGSFNGESINFTDEYSKAIECSIEEIRHLLPPNHPDLNLDLTINNFEIG